MGNGGRELGVVVSDSQVPVPLSFFAESARYAVELASYYQLVDLMAAALMGEEEIDEALSEYWRVRGKCYGRNNEAQQHMEDF